MRIWYYCRVTSSWTLMVRNFSNLTIVQIILEFYIVFTKGTREFSSYTNCYQILILDRLSNNFKSPCVVFTGHPSLRYGDVIHFMELWRNNNKNTVIFIGKYLLLLCWYFILNISGEDLDFKSWDVSKSSKIWMYQKIISDYLWICLFCTCFEILGLNNFELRNRKQI